MGKAIKKAGGNFICFVTCKGLAQAQKIAKRLLDKRLAACANIIGGVRSLYRWKGRLVNDREALMILKGRFKNRAEILSEIRSLHSYEVPEIIFAEIHSGFDRYIDWLNENS